ncbi:MAG TPA: MHYT domain-containing protein [Marinobacterium sp.]|nr:MHYT domain-containing protein [Marinobacterium sp.]
MLDYISNKFVIATGTATLAHDYSIKLVVLSVITAMVGSALALYLTEIMRRATSARARRVVRISGAIAFGGAVWSMHFHGMLAYSLSVTVSYDPWITLISALPAIIAAWVAINFIGKEELAGSEILESGALIGLGIGIMHFSGMEAMQMSATLKYDLTLFALAVIAAIALSVISLFLINHVKQRAKRWHGDVWIIGGIGFGLAISAMHYLGMYSSRFIGEAETLVPTPPADRLYLSILIFVGLLALLGNVLSGSLLIKASNRLAMLHKQKAELEENHQKLKHTQAVIVNNEKLVTLGTLSAGIAHELNNPIAYVSGNLHTLKEYLLSIRRITDLVADWSQSGNLSAEQQKTYEALTQEIDLEFLEQDIDELLEDTLDGSNRITSIVTNLRGFSRTGSRDRSVTQLNDGIQSTLRLLKSVIGSNQRVELDLKEIPDVYCNPNEINQIFVNLIVNASQASAEDGTIWISSLKLGDNVVVRIKDNGSGMPDSVKQRIFDPFFTTKPAGEGTGLGLSISRQIIESHNGELRVESEEGTGTLFELILPAYHGEASNQT